MGVKYRLANLKLEVVGSHPGRFWAFSLIIIPSIPSGSGSLYSRRSTSIHAVKLLKRPQDREKSALISIFVLKPRVM